MNAERFAEIRTRHRKIDPEIAAQWTDGWSGWYLADVGDLLAELDSTHLRASVDLVSVMTDNVLHARYGNLEILAAAYLAATNLRPDQCELVEQRDGDKLTWHFREREQPMIGCDLNKKLSCTCNRNVALYGHKPDCPAGGGT